MLRSNVLFDYSSAVCKKLSRRREVENSKPETMLSSKIFPRDFIAFISFIELKNWSLINIF